MRSAGCNPPHCFVSRERFMSRICITLLLMIAFSAVVADSSVPCKCTDLTDANDELLDGICNCQLKSLVVKDDANGASMIETYNVLRAKARTLSSLHARRRVRLFEQRTTEQGRNHCADLRLVSLLFSCQCQCRPVPKCARALAPRPDSLTPSEVVACFAVSMLAVVLWPR